MRFVLWALSIVIAGPAAAQTAFPCDWQARADAIVEPWEENSATFANGNVRVALLDVAEPAAAAFYLLITHPPYDELGLRTCTVVGLNEDLGCAAIFFNDLSGNYDPALDLVFEVPAIIYLPEQSFQNSAMVKIIVNQSSGDAAVSQRVGNE